MQSSLHYHLIFSAIFVPTVYGPWNLDSFRALYHARCISPHINLSLIDGAIGLYPLVLVAVLYTFVTLHDHRCKIIVQMWTHIYWHIFKVEMTWRHLWLTHLLHYFFCHTWKLDMLPFMYWPQLDCGAQMGPMCGLCTLIPLWNTLVHPMLDKLL